MLTESVTQSLIIVSNPALRLVQSTTCASLVCEHLDLRLQFKETGVTLHNMLEMGRGFARKAVFIEFFQALEIFDMAMVRGFIEESL